MKTLVTESEDSNNIESTPTRELTIIIVHFNELQHMPDVLDSLASQIYKNFKLLIIDNMSEPENRRALQELVRKYTELDIELIFNKFNVYYTGGNNTGFKRLQTPYVCVMNPDIVFKPDFLLQAMSFFGSDYKPDMFTPKAKFYAMKNRIWYAGAEVTPLKKIFSHHVGIFKKDSAEFSTNHETDYANGACLFIKKQVLDKIGFFDEILAIYSDDTDLSLRAKKSGFKVFYNGTCSFYHKVKMNYRETDKRISVRNSKFLYYLLLRNSIIILWKDFPLHIVVESYATWVLYNLIAATILNLRYKMFHLLWIHLRAVVKGTIIGLRRRTHRSCHGIFKSEMRYIKQLRSAKPINKGA
ncbi:MAG TPA: glycosyltransferase family 2 protein [Candidatus Lokiarchaeia archaeon]|nr:glycosyltransferase family 2 protein [Candidatus Lokiarchaeia archaeon]